MVSEIMFVVVHNRQGIPKIVLGQPKNKRRTSTIASNKSPLKLMNITPLKSGNEMQSKSPSKTNNEKKNSPTECKGEKFAVSKKNMQQILKLLSKGKTNKGTNMRKTF